MSSLFLDQDIWLVKLTMTPKVGGSTASYSFTLDWFNANSIYSGSPETYPLLVSNPSIRRSVGIYAGIRNDTTIEIYGKTSMTAKGTSFMDLLETYEIHNSDVVVYYYPKSADSATTDSTDNIQGILKGLAVEYDEPSGILRITARDVWFKDKEVSKKLTTDEIPDLDPRFDGEYGALVFGQSSNATDGIVIDAPAVASEEGSAGVSSASAVFFPSWSPDGHEVKTFVRAVAKNQHKKLDDSDWLTLNWDGAAGPSFDGSADVTGGTSFSLAEHWRGIAYSPAEAILCDAINVYLGRTGTIAAGDGEVVVEIFFAETTGGALPWSPVGAALRTAKLAGDYAGLATPGMFSFRMDPPIVLNPAESYFIRLSWTNTSDTTNYIYTKIMSDGPYTHFAQSKAESDTGWTTQSSLRLPLLVYWVGSNFLQTTSYATLETDSAFNSFDSGGGSSANPPKIDKGLTLKVGVFGVTDDASHTYTTSAYSVIENGSDIIRFVLMDDDFGLGITSAEVDTSKLSSVRTSLAALSIGLKIVIDRQTYAEDLIVDIARQTRTIFYKTRVGKLALHYPTPTIDPNIDYTFSEAFHRGDFILDFVRDNEYSQVVNYFRQYYAPDTLNVSSDPAVIRRAEREKLTGKIELSADETTTSDAARQTAVTNSEALYGRREHTAPLNFHDSLAGAKVIQNYLCDRYSTLQKRFRLQIPMRKWYSTLDMFTDIRAVHSAVPDGNGTALEGSVYDSGTGMRFYDEGVPGIVWAGGTITGQIIEVECRGAWMAVTCETTAAF